MKRFLGRLFKTRPRPRRCDNPHCQKSFISEDAIHHYCSSQCLRDHTASLGRGRRAGEDKSSRHAHQHRRHPEKKDRKGAHGDPSKSPSRSIRSHSYAPEYPSSLHCATPPPPYHYQCYYPVNAPPPFSHPFHSNAYGHGLPPAFNSPQCASGTPLPPAPSAPAHVHSATRMSPVPAPRRAPRNLGPYTGPTGRLLDAGHTPAIALARLHDDDIPDPTMRAGRSPSSPPRQARGRRRSLDSRYAHAPQPPVIHAPTPLRPQQMTIANLPSPCPTPESPLRGTSPEARHWHFCPPRTPSVSSCGDYNDGPTHGGLYNAEGRPMQILLRDNGHYYTIDSQTAPLSATAPFVQAWSRPSTAAPLAGYGRWNPGPGYIPSGARPTARARADVPARRAPRPRSNSFGGF
ncbi:hypothetical protein C8Q79DRAFT_532688 [Trametes meyenii]|nr:hypothetical protein C8Q79DRAFT_532688 [Trametes meyenii]